MIEACNYTDGEAPGRIRAVQRLDERKAGLNRIQCAARNLLAWGSGWLRESHLAQSMVSIPVGCRLAADDPDTLRRPRRPRHPTWTTKHGAVPSQRHCDGGLRW